MGISRLVARLIEQSDLLHMRLLIRVLTLGLLLRLVPEEGQKTLAAGIGAIIKPL